MIRILDELTPADRKKIRLEMDDHGDFDRAAHDNDTSVKVIEMIVGYKQ